MTVLLQSIRTQVAADGVYVAVSNTVIGVLMVAGGVVGVPADQVGTAAVVLLLGIGSLLAAGYILRLPEVSEA